MFKTSVNSESIPNPEVTDRPLRRRFTLDYKLRIIHETAQCEGRHGAVAAILRKEGLYKSHLRDWRRQYQEGGVDALRSKKSGPSPARSPLEAENERLRRENERLAERLAKAELIIEVQKKVSRLLDELPTKDQGGPSS